MTLIADIVDVVPDPRTTPVASVQITFNKVAKLVRLADFTLTRDGVNVPLAGPAQSVTGSGTSYSLNGLTTPTTPAGVYVVTLNAAGSSIISDDGLNEPLSNSPSDSWGQPTLWPGVTSCFRTAHLFHQSGLPLTYGPLPTFYGGALSPLDITTLVWSGTSYVITLNVFPPDQDFGPGDYVAIEQQNLASSCTGVWKVTAVNKMAKQLTLDVPPPGGTGPNNSGNGAGGLLTRWNSRRWDSLCSFTVSAAGKRGYEQSINLNDKNFLVPYNLTSIFKVVSATQGTAYGSLFKVRLEVPGHNFSTGDIVEVSGVRLLENNTYGSEIARGWWVVTYINTSFIELDNSIWVTGAASAANTGIVQSASNAIATRTAMMTGGTANPSALAIADYNKLVQWDRGYQQGMDDFRGWFETKSGGKQAGYYFSSSAVGTPLANLERGLNAGYPMILSALDKAYTNNWEISTSQNASGNLQITVAGGRTPLSVWANRVRIALIGHSNMSYCIDAHLNKVDSSLTSGGSGIRRLNGYNGLAASGTTTTLTIASGTLPNWLVGSQLYMEDGLNGGQSRTIKSVAGNPAVITVTSAFTFAIAANNKYRAGHLSFPVTAVSGQNITLGTPYRAGAGTGGAMMVMGKLATSGNSISEGAVNPLGGKYTRIATEVDHGLVAGDFIVVLGTQGAGSGFANCTRGDFADGTGGIKVHKVMTAPTSVTVDVDTPFVNYATGGRWYGTCLTVLPWFAAGSDTEATDEGRLDSPDCRRPEVVTIFNDRLKTLVNDVFSRHGARHIGFCDEAAFRYKASPASPILAMTPYSGETTDQIIDRIGQFGDWLQSTWARKMTVNTTAVLTKDTFNSTQRTNVINRWGGLMSEGACFVYDRSVYQMKGPDGYLEHITALLTGNARYYYAPQEIGGGAGFITSVGISSSVANGKAVKLITSGDSGAYPTVDESSAELGGTPHNHSGSIVGIYGHSVAAVNGVYHVRSRQSGNGVTIESRYTADGSGGTLVHCNYSVPVKIVSIAAASPGTRVTTEFPHGIPDATDEITSVRVFGYTGIDNTVTHAAVRVNDTQFDLPGVTYSADPATGICFYCRADLWHWLGLSYMLWQSGKALEYSSGSVALPVNTRRAYLPGPPTPLSADGGYTVTDFSGELTGNSAESMERCPKGSCLPTSRASPTRCWGSRCCSLPARTIPSSEKSCRTPARRLRWTPISRQTSPLAINSLSGRSRRRTRPRFFSFAGRSTATLAASRSTRRNARSSTSVSSRRRVRSPRTIELRSEREWA